MEIPALIRAWKDWPGWRRHGPSVGSVVVHGVAGLAAVALLTGAGRPMPPPVTPDRAMEVMLVADESPPQLPMRPPPAPKPAPQDKTSEPLPAPAASAPVDPRKTKTQQQASAPVVMAPSDDTNASPFAQFATIGPPRGLDGLAETDPCKATKGTRAKDCVTNYAAAGEVSLMPRTKKDLKTYYSEFIPDCPFKVGCDGGEWKSNNGTRSVAGTAMAVGSAGGGGISSLAGRAIINPDHVDPGFGD